MLDSFRSLLSLLKYRRIHIDGNIFRLHYTVTVLVLLAFTVIITTKQFYGDPILCESHGVTDKLMINYYCYIHTTFIVESALDKRVGIHVPSQGVINSPKDELYDRIYQSYYQWVCFVLFIQAVCFYIPRWMWKMWECGKMKALVADLDCGVVDADDKDKKKKMIIDYLKQSKGHNDWYAIRYFFCETLAFVNVIMQMWVLNLFFDYQFYTYGFDVMRFTMKDPEIRTDPMIRIFPKITKCLYHKFGPSGNVETTDILCVLPINIINEKIFIILWFWFLLLALITGVMLMTRFAIIAFPVLRSSIFKVRFRLANDNKINILIRRNFSIGDWLVLHFLGQNLDSVLFKEILEELVSHKENRIMGIPENSIGKGNGDFDEERALK